VTRESGITTIAFNRPEKRNAMSPQLHNEMLELLTELRYNSAGTVGILGRA
jgi:feruloyl-CoA hydratase/lyase